MSHCDWVNFTSHQKHTRPAYQNLCGIGILNVPSQVDQYRKFTKARGVSNINVVLVFPLSMSQLS